MFGNHQRAPFLAQVGSPLVWPPWRNPIPHGVLPRRRMFQQPKSNPARPLLHKGKNVQIVRLGQKGCSLPACNCLFLGALHAKNACDLVQHGSRGPVTPGAPLFVCPNTSPAAAALTYL